MLPSLRCPELRLLPKNSTFSIARAIGFPSARSPSKLCLLGSVKHGVVHHRSRSSHASETKDGIAERGPLLGTAKRASKDASAPSPTKSESLFCFDAGYALFAKRPSRPFPPPFTSGQSGSSSDALSVNGHFKDQKASKENSKHSKINPKTGGKDKVDTKVGKGLAPDLMREIETIKGVTNGDDAVLANERFIGANDGVGAWATKEGGHAA